MNSFDARAELLRNGWSAQTLDVWLRARGFCEYCGKDLQRSSDDYFHGYSIDHVVPSSLQGDNDPSNYALACRACNLIKRDQDFRHGDVNVARDELIRRAREYVHQHRERNQARLEAALRLLRECGL